MSEQLVNNLIQIWKYTGFDEFPHCKATMSLEDSKAVFQLSCPSLPQPYWGSNDRNSSQGKFTLIGDTLGDAFDVIAPMVKKKGYILETLGVGIAVSSRDPLVTENRYTFRLLDLSCISDLSDDDISLVRV